MSLNTLIERGYRALNRLVPSDITQVLTLDLMQLGSPCTATPRIDFAFLSAEEISSFSANPTHELNSDMAELINSKQARCYAATIGGELAAYTWVAKGRVAPEHNRGGGCFRGIGFDLPKSMAYIFKVLVLPAQRGKNLNGNLLSYLGTELKNEGIDCLITTTDWTNTAFLRSAAKTGFKQAALAGEFVVGSKHFYKLPALNHDGLRLLAGY
ncbi:MAG: GNAT family N-acetyltransferase [Pseudomonadales bacterium]